MRIGIIGSGTASTQLPAALGKQAETQGIEAVLVNPRLSTFARSAYERLVVDIGYVDAMQAAAEQKCDIIFINSFADYGIDAARAVLMQPIIGAGEATLAAASAQGTRPFSIVTVWPASMRFLYEERLRATGLSHLCCSIRHVSTEEELLRLGEENGVMARMASFDEAIITTLQRECVAAIEEDGALAIALGCTCMAPIGEILVARCSFPIFEATYIGLLAASFKGHLSVSSTMKNANQQTISYRTQLIPEIVSAWQARNVDDSTMIGIDCPSCIK